jgi:hypothetical protein
VPDDRRQYFQKQSLPRSEPRRYQEECDGHVSQVYGGAGKSMLGIGSQKTARVVVLRMRETCSLHCRLVDYALALPGENNTSEIMVTAERYPRRRCLSVQSDREGTEALAKR